MSTVVYGNRSFRYNHFLNQSCCIHIVKQMPPHICTVYRASDHSKTELIAKHVHEHSSELKILEYLRSIQPLSPHIISSVESVEVTRGEWVVSPKHFPIAGLSLHAPSDLFSSKLLQYGHHLIEGLAYLHLHGVAHLDIKPTNLVYTSHDLLQIIDFGSAVRVTSQSEEIEGLCGTRGWRAPELGNDEDEVGAAPVFSPIGADRWSCGQVLLWFVGEAGREDKALVRFASSLPILTHAVSHPYLDGIDCRMIRTCGCPFISKLLTICRILKRLRKLGNQVASDPHHATAEVH